MRATVTFMFFIGLCLNWAIGAQNDTFPRPTLWANPSPVVAKGENVTLRCQGRLGRHKFQLWKERELREERHESQEQAEFVIRDLEVERDARSYRCRYGQGNLWSELSEPLEVVVMTGELPTPSISTSPSSTIQAGKSVTVCCRPSQAVFSQEYTFALLKAKSLEPLLLQSTPRVSAAFYLQDVRAEDSGSYSCVYYNKTVPFRGSLPSQSLLLTVRGQLPKPTLRLYPGPIVVLGTNITLWCLRPKVSSLLEVEYSLYKVGNWKEPLRPQISVEPWTGFLLPSVKPEDTGSYRCFYRDRKDTARHSESSDALELLVTGPLPRPSLSSLPGLVVRPGTHVTLKCWKPPQDSFWKVTFILLKLGTPQPLQTQSPAGSTADFPLPSVRAEDAGNYTCVYHGRTRPLQVSQPSEVLEIWVTDSQPSNMGVKSKLWTQCNNTLLFTLICVSFLLLLCLLLLAFLCHQSIPGGSSRGANSRWCLCCSCLPWGISMHPNTEVPREEVLYTEVVEERPRESSDSIAEDSQELMYTQLNIKTLNMRNRDPLKTSTEPTFYASVSMEGQKAQKF